MKWVKTAIGAVIAVVSLGIVATSVHSMTQEKVRDEVVTFEVLAYDDVLDTGTITQGTYDKLRNLTVVDTGDNYYLDFYVNDMLINTASLFNFDSNELALYINSVGEGLYIESDDTIFIADYDFQVGDIVKLVEEVTQPPQLTGVEATLIMLAPIIMVSGVLYYIYPKKEGE